MRSLALVLLACLLVLGCGGGGGRGGGGGGGGPNPIRSSLSSASPTTDDGSKYEEIGFVGTKAGTAEITVTSSDFDVFVTIEVVNSDGSREVIAEDDDGVGPNSTNAKVRFDVTPNAQYRVLFTSVGTGDEGEFIASYSAHLRKS